MRKLVLDQTVDGWSLRLRRAQIPVAGRGEVLVRVRAAGLVAGEVDWQSNWVDRMAHPRTDPVPGREFAGTVTALGVGVAGLEVGDRIFGWAEEYMDGAAADYVVALARNVAPLPPSIDLTRAAALPFAATAAWQALFEHGAAVARDCVVVVGHRTVVGRVVMEFGRSAGLTMLTEKALAMVSEGHALASPVGLVVDTMGGLALRDVLRRLPAHGWQVVSMQAQVPAHVRGSFFLPEVDRAHLRLVAARVDALDSPTVDFDRVALNEPDLVSGLLREGRKVVITTDDIDGPD